MGDIVVEVGEEVDVCVVTDVVVDGVVVGEGGLKKTPTTRPIMTILIKPVISIVLRFTNVVFWF